MGICLPACLLAGVCLYVCSTLLFRVCFHTPLPMTPRLSSNTTTPQHAQQRMNLLSEVADIRQLFESATDRLDKDSVVLFQRSATDS